MFPQGAGAEITLLPVDTAQVRKSPQGNGVLLTLTSSTHGLALIDEDGEGGKLAPKTENQSSKASQGSALRIYLIRDSKS